jgi:DNA-binding NarL/FixJ family response regulator
VVIAVGSRQRLLLMGQLLVQPKRMRAAVTAEAEALASVRLHQPQLLIITDWLESGSVVSCVQTALQEVPGLRVFMIVSQQEQPPELWALEPLLDAMVLESDLGCEEAPLMRAFRELTRGQRYRSPSLRAAKAAESARAAAAPAGAPLTPRETEVLELIGQGLKDRQIAEALGVSHETARTYVKTVRRKLGGGSRLAAVASRWGR